MFFSFLYLFNKKKLFVNHVKYIFAKFANLKIVRIAKKKNVLAIVLHVINCLIQIYIYQMQKILK